MAFRSHEKAVEKSEAIAEKKSYQFEYKDYKTLELKQDFQNVFMEDLRKALRFYGGNTRPDKDPSSTMYLVGLQETKGPYYLKAHYKYFLKYIQNSQIVFSNAPTPFWIEIEKASSSHLIVKACFSMSDKESKSICDAKQVFSLDEQEVPKEFVARHIDSRVWMRRFETASFWSSDKFFDVYGSEDPLYEKNSYRLAFDLDSPDFIYIKDNTLLVWDGGVWRKPKNNEKTSSYPIALIDQLSGSQAKMIFWDCSGVFSKKIALSVKRSSALESSLEKEFSKIRQRSSSRITCKLGKKTALLKEGDWILKTSSGWKVLKKFDELEKYLALKLKGELFVFDRIEKKQGSCVLKGRLFDAMRTHYQTVRIPISKKKKNNQLHSKKNGISTKMADSKEEDFDEDFDPDDFDDEDEELLRYTHNL